MQLAVLSVLERTSEPLRREGNGVGRKKNNPIPLAASPLARSCTAKLRKPPATQAMERGSGYLYFSEILLIFRCIPQRTLAI